MDCQELVFSGHAIRRLFMRGIGVAAVRRVVAASEIVRTYPDDRPFPCVLILGAIEGSPVHVVVGRESETGRCYIITVYWPDPDLWEPGFRERKR